MSQHPYTTRRRLIGMAACSALAAGAGVALLSATLALSAVVPGGGPGRAQLLPFGEFASRDGRPGPGKTWKVSNESGRAIAASLSAIVALTPLVIDYDHQTLTAAEKGHLAPAAGWVNSVEWLDGKGLFGAVKWTPRAQTLIDGEEYRFISPVISFDEVTGEVTGVLMGALVNYPALLGMEPALSAALSALVAKPQEIVTMNREALCALLGLPATATDAQINTAVAALAGELPGLRTAGTELAQLRARPALSAALAGALGVPATADETAALAAVGALRNAQAGTETTTAQTIAALQGQIAQLSAVNLERDVTTVVDGAITEGKFVPAVRDYLMQMGRKDIASLRAYVAAQPKLEGLQGQIISADLAADNGGRVAALSADAKAVAAQFGLSVEQFAKAAKA